MKRIMLMAVFVLFATCLASEAWAQSCIYKTTQSCTTGFGRYSHPGIQECTSGLVWDACVANYCGTGDCGAITGSKSSGQNGQLAFTTPGSILRVLENTELVTGTNESSYGFYADHGLGGTYHVALDSGTVPVGYSVQYSVQGAPFVVGTQATVTLASGGDLVTVDWRYNPVTFVAITSGPATATAGTGFPITVEARDAFGVLAYGYRGTVTLNSYDPQAALLPENVLLSAHPARATHTYVASDNGSFTFTGVTLRSAGPSILVFATDSALGSSLASILGVAVQPGPANSLSVALADPRLVPIVSSAFGLSVSLTDAYGNPSPWSGTIAFAGDSAFSGGTLSLAASSSGTALPCNSLSCSTPAMFSTPGSHTVYATATGLNAPGVVLTVNANTHPTCVATNLLPAAQAYDNYQISPSGGRRPEPC